MEAQRNLILDPKPSSPLKLIRNTRAGTPAASPSRQVMNGNASAERSISSQSFSSSLRLYGPASEIAAHWSVVEVR